MIEDLRTDRRHEKLHREEGIADSSEHNLKPNEPIREHYSYHLALPQLSRFRACATGMENSENRYYLSTWKSQLHSSQGLQTDSVTPNY
jgi:hypothetical protein